MSANVVCSPAWSTRSPSVESYVTKLLPVPAMAVARVYMYRERERARDLHQVQQPAEPGLVGGGREVERLGPARQARQDLETADDRLDREQDRGDRGKSDDRPRPRPAT